MERRVRERVSCCRQWTLPVACAAGSAAGGGADVDAGAPLHAAADGGDDELVVA